MFRVLVLHVTSSPATRFADDVFEDISEFNFLDRLLHSGLNYELAWVHGKTHDAELIIED
jgi:hypothetical protein